MVLVRINTCAHMGYAQGLPHHMITWCSSALPNHLRSQSHFCSISSNCRSSRSMVGMCEARLGLCKACQLRGLLCCPPGPGHCYLQLSSLTWRFLHGACAQVSGVHPCTHIFCCQRAQFAASVLFVVRQPVQRLCTGGTAWSGLLAARGHHWPVLCTG
jgi:hypothetical protein